MAGEKIKGLVFAHEPGNMLVTDWTAGDQEVGLEGAGREAGGVGYEVLAGEEAGGVSIALVVAFARGDAVLVAAGGGGGGDAAHFAS
ncbi:hypothetical protein CNMCM8980_009963 [Aspergillus fumigatiaffinis]|nr:hypothetical protein CNMCM8980_009963 [Aspergillus fumigatiaffinis]